MLNRAINSNGDGSSGTDFLAPTPTLRKFLSFRGTFFFLQVISANLSQLVNGLKNECFVIERTYEKSYKKGLLYKSEAQHTALGKSVALNGLDCFPV